MHVPDNQSKGIISFLAHQRTGVLCCASLGTSADSADIWAMPVWYRFDSRPSGSRILEVHCVVPRWTDIAHQLNQETRAELIVQASSSGGLRWLQIQGTARPVEAPDWAGLLPRRITTLQPDALYLVVRVTPNRIDLFDEDLGWGIQSTLEW